MPKKQGRKGKKAKIQVDEVPPAVAAAAAADDASTEASLDIGACCLCHCCLDYSDAAAFSEEARQEDYTDEDDGSAASFYYRKNDPYLPAELQDANNALLYCDSCPRLFHQQCHFVPVLSSFNANKPWNCLICQVQLKQKEDQEAQKLKSNKKKHKHGKQKQQTKTKNSIDVVDYPYDDMFQSPVLEWSSF